MTEPSQVDVLLERLRAGELPENVRLAAARGALPLPSQDLLRVQVQLATDDPAVEVRETAARHLRERNPDETAELVGDADVSPQVAAYFAADAATPEAVLFALAQNTGCPEEALLSLAERSESEMLQRLLLNEVRLIESPEILPVLEANDGLSPRQRERLREIRLHFVEQPVPSAAPDEPPLAPDVAEQVVEAMIEAERYEQEASHAAPPPAVIEEEGEKLALFRIMEMSIAEKVKLAFLGTSEERSVLIRDANRVVAASVLKSPRVKEKDVENYVNMRSLSEELVTMIANKREWVRNYAVILGLVRHPKIPPRISMAFLPRLTDRDIKILSRDRNISETVRQQVRRAFMARTQRKTGRR